MISAYTTEEMTTQTSRPFTVSTYSISVLVFMVIPRKVFFTTEISIVFVAVLAVLAN